MTEPEPRDDEAVEPEEPEEGEPGKPGQPRELTPEEREELRKKIEQAREEDPNIYPIF